MISVIIPSIRNELVEDLREALARQTLKPDEVFVVEDVERRGPSWAREEGVRLSSGDLIVFIDDDCVPPENWLESLFSTLTRHNADFVSGTYAEDDPFLHERRMRKKYPEVETVNPVGCVGIGGNIMVKRHCLEVCCEKDGFIYNPAFGRWGTEDIELVWRIINYGFKTVYTPLAVRHLKRLTFGGYMRQQCFRGIGIAIFDCIVKASPYKRPPQKSILWGNKWYQKPGIRWVVAVILKLFGPFDFKGFSSFGKFFQYWCGEKMISFGYLYGKCCLPQSKG